MNNFYNYLASTKVAMNLRFPAGLFILLLLIVAPMFIYLGHMPIQMWDEARQAVSSLEMSTNHHWFVTYYDGRPDMWSTKPPLLIWLQVLSMKIWGINEFGLRFPSGFAAACTCLMIYWLCGYRYKRPLLGLISVLVLLTSQGYVMLHGTCTADYDTLLTCCTTAYCLAWFIFLQTEKAGWLYATMFFLIAAVLTKGVAGLLFTPALVLYTIYSKKLLFLVRQRQFYLSLAIFVFAVVGFYLLREHQNPGYLKAVSQNELGGRYGNSLENHRGTFLFYYNCLRKYQFNHWYLLLIPAIITGLFIEEKGVKQFTVYILFITLIFFLIISSAQTKLYWYAMPLYPFLAILIGILLYNICKLLSLIGSKGWFRKFNPLPYLFLVLIFFLPYRKTLSYVSGMPVLPPNFQENEHMVVILRDILHGRQHFPPCMVTWADYQPNVLWYINVINNKQHLFKFVPGRDFDPYGNVLSFKSETKKYIEEHYHTQILESANNIVILYKLNGTR
jgi:4-amino-4-deoxy-L-arabinose transferase-like glycosyltransferase